MALENISPMAATKAFWLLAAAFAVILTVHVTFLGAGLHELQPETEFLYEQSLQLNSAPGDFRVRMYLPQADSRTEIRDETLETADLDVDFVTTEAGRMLVISGHGSSLPRRVTYSASLVTQTLSYRTHGGGDWGGGASSADAATLGATEDIQTGHAALLTPLREIVGLPGNASDGAPSEDWKAADWQAAFDRARLTPPIVIARIFSYCNDRIAPAQFSGTTDALTTLRLGEASCGGKSRLMVALCRTVGIPARLVGGVIIGQSASKRTHHVWVECRQGDRWVPFDPLNGHFAALPGNYLRLYTGDEPLISYSRGLAFDYGFKAPSRSVPRSWATPADSEPTGNFLADLARQPIPLLERGGFSLILLAPFALLLIVFARQVVGIDSIGVFLPILLGFSLTQTGYLYGAAQILLCLGLGSLLRLAMARLNLLHVSRAAVMITAVILLFLAFSGLQRVLGYEPHAGELILPLAALAMAIEKFIVVAMDKGTRGALGLLAQTLLLSVGCAVILSGSLYQHLMIAYPETLLLVTGLIIVVGNYRGLRWKEHLRFGSLLRGEAKP